MGSLTSLGISGHGMFEANEPLLSSVRLWLSSSIVFFGEHPLRLI